MKICSAAVLALIGSASLLPGGAFAFLTPAQQVLRSSTGATAAASSSQVSTRLFLPQQSFHRQNRSTARFVLSMTSIPSIDLETASPEQIEALVRSEYDAWLKTFGKVYDGARYPIFKNNYLLQLQYDQKNAVYCGLNQFGDLTPAEYEALMAQPEKIPELPATSAVSEESIDHKVRNEYIDWAGEYSKQMSDDRYEIFKQNFLANMKYYDETGKYHVLNEYADTTPEEYQALGGHLVETENDGSGLPSYMLGMTTPAAASSSPPSGAGMPSFADSLSGGYNSNPKAASYMPKSFNTQSSGSGIPSYFDKMESASSGTSHSPPPAPLPPVASSTYTDPSVNSGLSSGAGLPSFADSLSGSSGQMKQSSYMPKSYKKGTGSGMPSYLENMSGGSGSSSSTVGQSYLENLGGRAAPTGTGLPSFADSLSGSGGQRQQASYMPNSYKQSAGSGLPSYFDNLQPQDAVSPPPADLEYTKTSLPTNIQPNDVPSNGIKADQAAQLARVHSPSRGPGPSGHPLAVAMTNPYPLKCDQTLIMREGEAFLPHAQDPVVKRRVLPDQNRFFFTGRALASERFKNTPMERRFPSDQERADNITRRSLMHFQSPSRPQTVNRNNGPSSGAGLPSFADSLSSGSRGPQKGNRSSGPPSGAGLPSFADSLSSGSRGPPMKKKNSYMPKSFKKTSGSGMPSYFDGLSGAANRPEGGRPRRNF